MGEQDSGVSSISVTIQKHCPPNTPTTRKFRFEMSGSRNFQWDHFLVSRFGTKLNRSAPFLFRVFRGLNSEWTRLSETVPTALGGRDDVPGVPNISAAAWIYVQLRRAEPDAPYHRLWR